MAKCKTSVVEAVQTCAPLASPPGCSAIEALASGRADLMNLFRWVHLVECSQCEFEIDPRDLAEMVGQRLQAVIQFMDSTLEQDRACDQGHRDMARPSHQ